MNTTREFAGRVAVVTGAAGGMGSAVADRLAQAGASVFGVDLKPAPRRVASVPCDISDPAAVARGAARIRAEAGRIDLLVNAAGMGGSTRPMEAISDESWRRVMGVNVDGAFYWMRAVLPGMRERRFGKIVNVSSRAGRTLANFAGAHYSASKAALLGLTRQVAFEVAPDNVHVNAIAPGLVRTQMLDEAADPDRIESVRMLTPLRRIGTVEDVADLVLFLLSSRSDFITGATVDINGGDLIM